MPPPSPWFDTGFVRLGALRGVPVLAHWSLPVGLYLLAGMRWLPAHHAAVTLLVLAHELGHAWLARRRGARVVAVKLVPLGGLCEWEGDVDEVGRSVIAWGGVLAQLAVYVLARVAAAAARARWGALPWPWLGDVEAAWTQANLLLIGLNLLPVAPLDGHLAWRLPLRALERAAQRHELARVRRQATAMRQRRAASELPEAPAQPAALAQPEPSDALVHEQPVSDDARRLADAMWADATRRDDARR